MAFAAAARTSQLFTASNNTYDVALPALTSGDLILIWFANWISDASAPAGYSEVVVQEGGGYGTFKLCYKVSDGTETIATFEEVSTAENEAAVIIYVVSGWGGTLATDIDFSPSETGVSNTVASVGVTAGWGADDNLVLSFAAARDDAATYTAFPTGFANTFQIATDTGANSSAEVASCEKQVTTADETIGTYTLSELEAWGTIAVIIKPGTSGGGATGPNTPINLSITDLLATSARLNWEQG
jgi:hypothetical protein